MVEIKVMGWRWMVNVDEMKTAFHVEMSAYQVRFLR